ncbi:MAG TPA: hypothetical protein VIN61_06570 [Gammaproteobacteria bacterium]
MSFREKSAWVTLIAILIVATMYFLHVPSVLDPDRASGRCTWWRSRSRRSS